MVDELVVQASSAGPAWWRVSDGDSVVWIMSTPGALPRGQVWAGYALGLNYWQTMAKIVLPQAFRNMVPVLLTQTIILFQDTSLVYAVGAYDLLKGFEVAGKNFNRPVEMYLLAAVTYFVICFSLSMLVRQLQKKIAIIR